MSRYILREAESGSVLQAQTSSVSCTQLVLNKHLDIQSCIDYEPCTKTDSPYQQESGAEPAQEAAASDNQPSCHQEGQLAAVQGDVTAADPETLTDQKTKEEEETDAEQRDKIKAEQQETEEGQGRVSDEEEGKGVKRKREEVHREEEAGQSTEKKKVKIPD